ncbi:MAG: hypothetical protein V1909_04370 [Candidatus Micrarchaeota archaeon]
MKPKAKKEIHRKLEGMVTRMTMDARKNENLLKNLRKHLPKEKFEKVYGKY